MTKRNNNRLLLLRHGEVASHKGDVPVTQKGLEYAEKVGRIIGGREKEIHVLTGETLRTKQTAGAIVKGAQSVGCRVLGPKYSSAMRNPDIYVAGERVNLVSSVEALADQISGFTTEQAAEVPFFKGFLSTKDRIGYWLGLDSLSGENKLAVYQRVLDFAASIADVKNTDFLTVAVTHSPVLRACSIGSSGKDTGEPNWVAGLRVTIESDRTVQMEIMNEIHEVYPLV